MLASKIARRRGTTTTAAATTAIAAAAKPLPQLPDAVLRDDWRGELGSPRQVVSAVEARVFGGSRGSLPKNNAVSSRTRAAELHREAEQLFFKGDYESALVLYHRAAKLCPREATHAVAARRAEAAIRRAANPGRKLGRMLRQTRVPGQEAAVLDPEAAARRAREIVAEARDPVEEIPRILRYLDAREDFWRISSPANTPRRAIGGSGSRTMRRQLNKCVRSTVKDVEAARDSEAVRKLSEELLSLVTLTDEPRRNQLDALAYLGTKQLALGRHDRAIDLAANMLFRARTDNDTVGIVKALAFIGKVHLSFGHLDALVRVWLRLVGDLSKEPVAQAWLYHDIGRCQLELNDAARALESASLCIARAESVGCKKWLLRGYLLSGQSLLKSARLPEAVTALKATARIAAEVEQHEQKEDGQEGGEEGQSILLYVHGLIDQLTCLLRRLNRGRGRHERDDDQQPTDLPEIRERGKLSWRNEGPAAISREHVIEKPAAAAAPLPSQSQEEVARLLARTRALRATAAVPKDNGHPEVPPVDLSDVTGDNDDGDVTALSMDTSRTRVIRKADDHYLADEQTLGPDELAPLADFSLDDDLPSADEEMNDFADGAEGKSGLALTSRSYVSSLDSPREFVEPPIRTNVLSDYLRSLESQEFLAQERQYIAGMKSTE